MGERMNTRRSFLGLLGIGAGAAVAGPVVAKAVVAAKAIPVAPAISTAGLSAIAADMGEVNAWSIRSPDGVILFDARNGRLTIRGDSIAPPHLEVERLEVPDQVDWVLFKSGSECLA